jgi:tetratricopeptide (TPR) repeat protein
MSADPLVGLAHIARFEDRDADALQLLESALELDPEDIEALVSLGSLHHDRGRLAEAEDAARRALEIEPERQEALVLMGYVHLSRGDVEAAREHAIWALRATPTDAGAIRLLAAVKARQSLLWGVWYRANARLFSYGSKAVAILLGMFVVQIFARLILSDVGLPGAADVVRLAWLALCVYSWVGPARFNAMVRKELESVRLRSDY